MCLESLFCQESLFFLWLLLFRLKLRFWIKNKNKNKRRKMSIKGSPGHTSEYPGKPRAAPTFFFVMIHQLLASSVRSSEGDVGFWCSRPQDDRIWLLKLGRSLLLSWQTPSNSSPGSVALFGIFWPRRLFLSPFLVLILVWIQELVRNFLRPVSLLLV